MVANFPTPWGRLRNEAKSKNSVTKMENHKSPVDMFKPIDLAVPKGCSTQ